MSFQMMLNYDELQLITALNNKCDLDGKDLHSDTCLDYVDTISYYDEQYWVIIFVEPVGNIAKSGKSVKEVLNWWLEVFRSQPQHWNYIKAGWHLFRIRHKLPDNPKMVWRMTISEFIRGLAKKVGL